MKKVILKIEGMTCSACSNGLEKYLNKQVGVKNAVVNLIMNNASIEYEEDKIDIKKIEEYIKKAGFKSLGIDDLKVEEKKGKKEKNNVILIGIIFVLTMYISMTNMLGLSQISILNMYQNPFLFSVTLFLFATIVLFLARDILKNGYKNLIHGTPNMDTLVALGLLSSYIYSVYNTYMVLRGGAMYAHNLYFEAVVMIVFFVKLGKQIETRNKDKSKETLKGLVTITPQNATLIIDEKEKVVTIDEIKKGDRIICKPGEKISVDGKIISGLTHVDESFITGESKPVLKKENDNVIAGSINYEGSIIYEAEKIGKDSTISEIVKMVYEATNTKVPIAKVADKISGRFVPAIIIIAIVSFLLSFILYKNFAQSINIFVSVLVVACPCSLGLATPLSVIIASTEANKKGIIIKQSEVLENAAKILTAIFDKTGTLTKGALTVSKIYNYTEFDETEILEILASGEKNSSHPIALAIVNFAKEKNIKLKTLEEFKEFPGKGIVIKINGNKYYIGNKKLLEENNINLINEKDLDSVLKEGNSIVFLANESKVLALTCVKDVLKESTRDVILKLKKENIHPVMLTGDNEKTAKVIADAAGIESVVANVSPKRKSEVVKEYKQKGITLMCGDGINDSVALNYADVGVSFFNGTDIAANSSNVILMTDNLERILDLILLSKKTLKNIKQNLFWAFIYNTLMIPIAMGLFSEFGIVLNPMIASFAMTISSLTVVLNSLRLRKIWKK